MGYKKRHIKVSFQPRQVSRNYDGDRECNMNKEKINKFEGRLGINEV